MRVKLILAAIFVQFAVLGWMAVEREWIVRNGRTVWLRTAPVDPRDIFRGDFVRLGYDISTIPAEKFGPGLKQHLEQLRQRNGGRSYGRSREIVLYVSLAVDAASGVAEVASADLTPPAAGPCIKGRVSPYWNDTALTGVAYGIDAYFVQQGSGYALERRAPEGAPDDVQVPMEMQVALGRNGTAVLKDHRWNPLGIGIRIKEASPVIEKPARKLIHVTLFNASAEPQTVVLPEDLRTLCIQRVDGGNGAGSDACPPRQNPPPLTAADLRVLQAGESTVATIDPARPEWFVRPTDEAALLPLGHKDGNSQSYRIVYTPPAPDAIPGGTGPVRVTPGRLAGRQFGAYEFRD